MTDNRKETHLDLARLEAVIEPVVRAHGGEVVAVEWKQEPGGWVLRVFVEKAGSAEARAKTADASVSLELCAGVARDLSPALDVADAVPHRYSLEVSSPGVERPLRDARDYARFAGEKAKLRLREPVEGQKVLVGTLETPSQPGSVGVRDGSRLFVVPLDQVVSGRLVFEFGPAPKPKGGRAHGKATGDAAAVRKREQRAESGQGPEETSDS
jgi:ribosome maturation factor RimP